MGQSSDPEIDLLAYVKKSLEESGYPLEMRVAAAFRSQGFITDSARYYVEHDGKTLREIDVVAQGSGRNSPSPHKPWLYFAFVIECKAGRDKPWVAFLGDDRFARDEDVFDSIPHEFLSDTNEYGDPNNAFASSDLRGLHATKLLYSIEPYAYSIAVPGGQNDGAKAAAYNAVRQVSAGVDGLARDFAAAVTRPQLRIFVPIVVTAAPLFTCRLDGRGELQLARADRVLLVARLRPAAELTSVWIVQDKSLGDLVADARQTVEKLYVA
ncbi:hypothetical protein GCM10009547_47390 [Sporichthya brevicatena]|uniref:DUF4365 domain-containing protein n=1 Tax=Sporichthya brevicatena TaxID=171442 RepID=A0ABP3SG78_9ACTN